MSSLHSLTGGFDFSEVLAKYYEAFATGDDGLKAAALKWLRAEYANKTEARQALGVRSILGDDLYENLKLVAAFSVIAGNAGILVNIDELVVLSHRLPNRTVRQANFEAILAMINDCLQGGASHLGFLLAGTVECVEDSRRGLFSYEALRSRLSVGSGESAYDALVACPLTRDDCHRRQVVDPLPRRLANADSRTL